MTVINIIFTMFLVLLTVGLSVGYACADLSRYSYGYYYYSGMCMIHNIIITILLLITNL